MKILMPTTWVQQKAKLTLLAILGGFLFCQVPFIHAQTQDTTWQTPVPPLIWNTNTLTARTSTNIFGNSGTSSTPSFSTPIHLVYRTAVEVDEVLLEQLTGPQLTYSYNWYASYSSNFGILDVYVNGITFNDLQYLSLGIVITIDDIRGSEAITFPQLNTEALSMTPYPNPTQGELQIDIEGNESEPMNLKVYNIQGQCVLTRKIIPVNESLTIPLSLKGFSPGTYWLQLQGSSSLVKAIQLIR